MKPLFSFIFIFCISNSNIAKAQITKGFWQVGGDANFISSTFSPYSSSANKQSRLEIAPTIGYFFFDKFSAGLKIDIAFSHSATDSTASGSGFTTNASSYLFGPYMRYYFLNEEKALNFFAEANYGYGLGVSKNYGMSRNTTKSQQFTFMAGPEFFFTQSVGLEFTIGYYYYKQTGINPGSKGFQMGLGFMIHLERDN
ncbi:MAG TPA: outer membrane beta-barrel protein [Hanamia sp.]